MNSEVETQEITTEELLSQLAALEKETEKKVVFVNGQARVLKDTTDGAPVMSNRKARRAVARQLAGRKGDRKGLYKALIGYEVDQIEKWKVTQAELVAHHMNDTLAPEFLRSIK